MKLRWIEVNVNPPTHAIPIKTVTGTVYRVLQYNEEMQTSDEYNGEEWIDVPFEPPTA